MNSVNNNISLNSAQQPADNISARKSDTDKKTRQRTKKSKVPGTLHKNSNSKATRVVEASQSGFIKQFCNCIKELFGFVPKKKPRVAGPKVLIDDPHPKNPFTPKVLIHDGLIDMDFIQKNKDKYVFVLSGNVESSGGKYGQSAVLRPAKEAFPGAIVELPVTRAHANVLDPSVLRDVSFKENSEEEIKSNINYINAAVDEAIIKSCASGRTILLIKGGYGTGGARMFAFAPKTFKAMNRIFEEKLGVRNLLDPVSAKYSLDYVSETHAEVKPDAVVSSDKDFSPEEISQDLWKNGWSLSRHKVA